MLHAPLSLPVGDRWRLLRAREKAAAELPAEWLPVIEAEAKAARLPGSTGPVPDAHREPVRPFWHSAELQREVWADWLEDFADAGASNLSDSEIKARAVAFALEARNLEMGELTGDGRQELDRLAAFCRARHVDPPPDKLGLKGMASRVRCPYWWRRALRRMVARKCERGAMRAGLVSKPAGQPYASNSAVWRRLGQNASNAAAAESIYFENDAGQVASLAELAARSTSNKAIRRGELMTRIRGCEEIADECGHPGLFLTLTCPSRFHSTLRDGRRNPKHDGSTPRDAQMWLRKTWELARAKLHRAGLGVYGFRVAEPHHDGCTHWHALFWFGGRDELHRARRIIRDYWLRDAGDEPGADRYRIHTKKMIPGRASGYVAKYISKNIDDHAITSHLDDYAESPIVPDLLGDMTLTPAVRVEAWASTWGIRQFQAIGQPPVGVWRELRRVKESEARAAGFGGIIWKAWTAAQRWGEAQADWARYVKAQGGMMRGRRCHVHVRSETWDCEGLYGRAPRRFPVGVALNVRGARIVWSNRRLWRSIESSEAAAAKAAVFAAQRAAPRTGVNNCTADPDAAAVRADFLRGQGGANPEKTACPVTQSAAQCSARPPKPPPMRL